MLIYENPTRLSWPLRLAPTVGRAPPLISTIGEAALFGDAEVRLGLADDRLWRQSLEKLLVAHLDSSNDALVLQATRVMQEALYASNLLHE
jgi:hypothetical protein